MQISCPCCNRSLNVYPNHKPAASLTRDLVNEALEAYDYECSLDGTERGYIDQSLVMESSYEDEIGVMLDSTDVTINCTCSASFVISFPVMLTSVKLPVHAVKSWLSEDVKDSLDIEDEPVVRFERDYSHNTGFHGASVKGCVHNYVFQRRVHGTNEAEVKCSRCGDTKRM